jgi:hypothetical protein
MTVDGNDFVAEKISSASPRSRLKALSPFTQRSSEYVGNTGISGKA